jgi:hypothetical protein
MSFTGFAAHGATSEAVVPEPKTFDKGLIFVKETDVLLSGDKWTIVVNIALDDYDSLIYVMRATLNQVRQKIKVHQNPKPYSLDIHWDEISRLDVMVQGLDTNLLSLKKLLFTESMTKNLKIGRSKRGLINVLGYGLKYLFGTADARDVKRISATCDELHKFKVKMMHAVEHQMTYIRVLDETVKQNTGDIMELTEVLRDSISNLSLGLNRVEADLLDTQRALEKQVRYSTAIREIEAAILELKLKVIQLQEAIDVTSAGQLSSVLIHPYNLSMILQQVSLQLPAGLSMLTGLTVQDMYVYYAIAVVHAVATSQSIRLLVDIPLKANDRYFELYQVHSLPFFHKGIGKFVMIDEPFTYLAVAESRQFFAMITPYELSKCTQDLYTVCPSDMVLRTASEPNCLISLFLGKSDMMFSTCRRLIISELFEPVWVRSPDASYWIYSLSTPQRITIQCQEPGSLPKSISSSQIMIEGTGVLPNSSSCYVHAEAFKLMPHSSGQTTVTLTKANIALPNVENLLKSSEEVMLQPQAIPMESLQRLNALATRTASRNHLRGTDVPRAMEVLQQIEPDGQTKLWPWFAGVIVVSIIFGSLWSVWFKVLICCYNFLRNSIKPSNSDQTLNSLKLEGNELQTELQVPAPAGAELDPSPALPEFVRHGVLRVDH